MIGSARPAREPEAPPSSDDAAQERILPRVSRTFALTIPQLPGDLRPAVTNAYLLCRIADTIEDEPALATPQKRAFHQRFAALVAVQDEEGALDFAREVGAALSERTPAAERELIATTPAVLRITHGFRPRQRVELARCVRVMCEGMPRFQDGERERGLADVDEFHQYCYYVAGVVGEMLTELFCDHSREIDARRDELARRAVSFGQGLQMTNILKDIWEDLDRGFCWLPRDVFRRAGFDLRRLSRDESHPEFERALGDLIGLARAHLQDALEYTLLIPGHERGIRRFCLWALGMAILTLRKIDRRRGFHSGVEVKISRRSVKATILASNVATSQDTLLRLLFAACATGLPRPASAASLAVQEG